MFYHKVYYLSTGIHLMISFILIIIKYIIDQKAIYWIIQEQDETTFRWMGNNKQINK